MQRRPPNNNKQQPLVVKDQLLSKEFNNVVSEVKAKKSTKKTVSKTTTKKTASIKDFFQPAEKSIIQQEHQEKELEASKDGINQPVLPTNRVELFLLRQSQNDNLKTRKRLNFSNGERHPECHDDVVDVVNGKNKDHAPKPIKDPLSTKEPKTTETAHASKQQLRTPSKRSHLKDDSACESPHKVKLSPASSCISPKHSPQSSQVLESSPPAQMVPNRPVAFSSPTQPKGLTLPFKYKKLEEKFKSLDAFLNLRWQQPDVTWSEIEKNMWKMTRSIFTRKELAQIKFVFPESYAFGMKQVTTAAADRKSPEQLVVSPIHPDGSVGRKRMSTTTLVKRRQQFNGRLLRLVRTHHQNFLYKLDASLHVGEGDLRSWHPGFNLDTLPDVPTVDLVPPASPPPLKPTLVLNAPRDAPEKRAALHKNARECLKRLAEHRSEMARRRSGLVDRNNPLTTTQSSPPQPPLPLTQQQPPRTDDPALKGLPASLLEKIRQKELLRMKCSMTRSAEDQEKLKQLRALPHIARLLSTLYTSERKNSLKFDFVCSKLHQTRSKHIESAMVLEKQLRMLAEDPVLKKWLAIVTVSQVDYVRMDRAAPINDVVVHLQKRARRFESTGGDR